MRTTSRGIEFVNLIRKENLASTVSGSRPGVAYLEIYMGKTELGLLYGVDVKPSLSHGALLRHVLRPLRSQIFSIMCRSQRDLANDPLQSRSPLPTHFATLT